MVSVPTGLLFSGVIVFSSPVEWIFCLISMLASFLLKCLSQFHKKLDLNYCIGNLISPYNLALQ